MGAPTVPLEWDPPTFQAARSRLANHIGRKIKLDPYLTPHRKIKSRLLTYMRKPQVFTMNPFHGKDWIR
jgi:hypothetical protein